MNVKTLCLGLLTFGAASGYDLKKRFEGSFRFFYSAGYGSIYPALADLADAGLVTCEQIVQDGRPDRKLYRITPAGRRQFVAALETSCPTHKMRSEFLAMLFFAHLMSAEQIRQLLDHRVKELGRLAAELEEGHESTADQPAGVEFVRGFGATIARAARDYIEQHRHLLEADKPDRLAS